jgi:hypothetical protein
LLQPVHERSVRHCATHDPRSRADRLRPWLVSTFNDDLMPDRIWDDDFAIDLAQEI